MHSLLPHLLLAWWWWCLRLTAATTVDNLRFPIITKCSSNMNYTRGSAFQANLDAILSSLPDAAAASSGFAENVTGAAGAPDMAYGLAQCRGDVGASDCRACLNDTAHEMASACPGQKSAMRIYEGCLLRYSNASFFGDPYTSGPIYELASNENATQPERFMPLLAVLMGNLTREAAYGSPRRFAAGQAQHTSFETLYGLVQCTRDTSAGNCKLCLDILVTRIPKCCNGSKGGRIFSPICQLRFEMYQFYDPLAAQAAMSPAPAPRGGGAVNGSDLSGPRNPATTVVAVGAGSNSTVRTALISVSILAAVTTLLLLFVAAYSCKKNRKTHKHVQIVRDGHGDEEEEMRSSEPDTYDLSTLRAATDNFSEENQLGEGGFGPVYKGTLPNGQVIAVKRLSRTSQQGHVEMKNEVVLVAKLQHKNLVRLLGCCIEEDENLLVYEFLINKSLDKILSDPTKQQELSWGQRYKIIEGIGRGLLYLHEDSRLTIIHRDLKPGNILLDGDMNPKISDFGLAKLYDIALSMANTSRIAGTYGYMAPEYAMRGTFSTKSDVYSYGVLVLEIVTGRRPAENLINFVWGQWSRQNVSQLLEGCPADGPGPQEMLRCIHVGLLCVQEDPRLRPSMASVVIMLNSRSITLPIPTEPAFLSPGEAPRAAAAPAPEPSINEGSVSDLEPR